jgi:hypothetical protein
MTARTPDKRHDMKQLVAAAIWGGGTMLVAYLLSFGSILLFVVNIVVIAIGARLAARVIARRPEG